MRFENIRLLSASDSYAGLYRTVLSAEWQGAPARLSLAANGKRSDVEIVLGDDFKIARVKGDTVISGEFPEAGLDGLKAYVQRLSVELPNALFPIGKITVSYERGIPQPIEDLGDHGLGRYLRAIEPLLEEEEGWETGLDLLTPSPFASLTFPTFLGNEVTLDPRQPLIKYADSFTLTLPDDRTYSVSFHNAGSRMPDLGVVSLSGENAHAQWMIGAPVMCEEYWPHQAELNDWIHELYRVNLGEDFTKPSATAELANRFVVPEVEGITVTDVTWNYAEASFTVAGDVCGMDLAVLMSCNTDVSWNKLPLFILDGNLVPPKLHEGTVQSFRWPKDKAPLPQETRNVAARYAQALIEAREKVESDTNMVGVYDLTGPICDGLVGNGAKLELARAYAHETSRWALSLTVGSFTVRSAGDGVVWFRAPDGEDPEILTFEEGTRRRTVLEVAEATAVEAGLEAQYDFMGFLVGGYLMDLNATLREYSEALSGNVSEEDAMKLFSSWTLPSD